MYPKKKPIIAKAVFIAGTGSTNEDGTLGPNTPTRHLAIRLAEMGIVTARFPKRAKIYKTLTYDDFTIEQEFFEDTLSCVNILKADRRANHVPLLLIGHSLGAMLAPHIAKKIDVDGIVMLGGSPRSPYVIIPEQLKHLDMLCESRENINHHYFVKYNPICKRAEKGRMRRDFKLLSFPKAYLNRWREYSLSSAETVKKASLPTLIMGFGTDYQSTKEDFRIYRKNLSRNKNVHFVWLEDINHFFMKDKKPASDKRYQLTTPISEEIALRIHSFVTKSLPTYPHHLL